jgi:hypothetical protein
MQDRFQSQETVQSEVLSFSATAKMVVGSARSWSRHWKFYVATRGFPAPLPSHTSLRRPKWSRAQVVAWIRSGGRARPDFDSALQDYEASHAA